MPDLASIHGADIDRVFGVTLAISGALFMYLFSRFSICFEIRVSLLQIATSDVYAFLI
jgi:hypothetical protein